MDRCVTGRTQTSFGGRGYDGEVAEVADDSVPGRSQWRHQYTVTYEDGDEEDYTLGEILPLARRGVDITKAFPNMDLPETLAALRSTVQTDL